MHGKSLFLGRYSDRLVRVRYEPVFKELSTWRGLIAKVNFFGEVRSNTRSLKLSEGPLEQAINASFVAALEWAKNLPGHG